MRHSLLGLLILLVISPSIAQAKEILIICTLNKSNVTSSNPVLDKRLNESQDISTRQYVIDDSSNSVWKFVDGKKSPFCEPQQACTVDRSTTKITKQTKSDRVISNLYIDRLEGTILDNIAMLNSIGQTAVFMSFSGTCQLAQTSKPKF